MADQFVDLPTIFVDGTELSAGAVNRMVEVIVDQAVNVPDMFRIRFADPEFALFDDGTMKIGKAVKIEFSDEDTTTEVTSGEITSISVEPGPEGRHEMVVTGLARSHRLARSTKTRTFQGMKADAIVKKIGGEYGLGTSNVEGGTAVTYSWILQNETDYSFIDKLALAEGYDWWVSESDIYFKAQAKAGTSPKVTWPADLNSFKVRFSAAEATKDAKVRGWDPAQQKSFEGTVTASADAANLGSAAPSATAADQDMDAFKATRLTGLAPVLDQAEAQALAGSIVERGLAEEVIARGVAAGNPDITAATELEVDGLGENLSGKYVLTSAEHVFRAGERYLTRFVAGGKEAGSIVDLLGGSGRQPSPLGERLLIGVVTVIEDDEDLGRVKVKFPTLSDDDESYWARLASPGAGKERGLMHIPEVNDEVLVGFENGDPRRPIVLGGLWSGKFKPPQGKSDAIASKKVVSRQWKSRVGHTITMSDGESEPDKSVAIDLSDGKTALYLGEDKVTLDTPKTLTITAKDNIGVKAANKKITIEAGTITLKASQKLVLEAPQVEIKGSATATLEAAKIDIKASGMLNAEASGIASVKGSLLKLN